MKPLFESSKSVDSFSKYAEATGDKKICKSSYYAIKYALQLIPDLLELKEDPTKTKIYRVADLQIKSRSIVLLINNAWQFIIDHGTDNELIAGFIGGPSGLTAIKELRARCEVTALEHCAAIRPRQDKWGKSSDETPPSTEWKEILREWLNSDYTKPLNLENLRLSAKDIQQYRSILSTMGMFEYVVEHNIIRVRLNQTPSV